MTKNRIFDDNECSFFEDKLKKCANRFKLTVLCCFALPFLFHFTLTSGIFAPSFLTLLVFFSAVINICVIIWGIRLSLSARIMWFKKNTCSFSTMVAFLPLSALVFQYSSYCV
ncbi:hypothetical protein A8L45_19385 [Veronia pacifica]|uniref:Uncharacterized protein n=1 Tax=Veronia pacifica TaxID=1080227 RepID=A0A1C3EBV5_9GAMM|nr:hypothetical protein A8L45_19385 [Veronia pacifica]